MYYLTPKDYEKAEKNGIGRHMAYLRFYHRGWSLERTINTPNKKKMWERWKEEVAKNGLSKGMFYTRMNQLGWSPEKAATTPKKRVILPEEAYIKATELGISKPTLHQRIRLGWSVEDACSTPLIPRDKRKSCKKNKAQ